MKFVDRTDAGLQLAAALTGSVDPGAVVVGLPRGGVPIAAVVAEHLGLPLDVFVVRKVGVPGHPEVAMGAVGEGGVEIVNHEIVGLSGTTGEQFATVAARERTEVTARAARFRHGRARHPLVGRTVVIVDDGMATGSTMALACRAVRAHGAATIVVAVPVAPHDAVSELAQVAEEVVCLQTAWRFHSVGSWYGDFSATDEDEVVRLLDTADARCAAARDAHHISSIG